MSNTLFTTNNLRIEIEQFEIPWLKVFTIQPYKEFSETPYELKLELLKILDIIEKEMICYFQPDKINIASFGNYVPHVHFHIQARFKNDSFFPEPTWGQKQRESDLTFDLEPFYNQLKLKFESEIN